MILKVIATAFFYLHFGECGLLKTPKVYNALITTDENISPSQSYPVIQPHIHESGIAYPAYSLGGYSGLIDAAFYDPAYSFAAPNFINPTFLSRHNDGTDIGLHNNQEKQNTEHQPNDFNADQAQNENINSTVVNHQLNDEQRTNQQEPNSNQQPVTNNNNLPIPLNEFGLPPSLIPMNPYNYNFNAHAISLAPYTYNSYPLVYDQYTRGFNQNPYLPPFGYYPQAFTGIDLNKRVKGLTKKTKFQQNQTDLAVINNNENSSNSTRKTSRGPTIDIKNYANKNKDIPDVPPPPIPSGAKAT